MMKPSQNTPERRVISFFFLENKRRITLEQKERSWITAELILGNWKADALPSFGSRNSEYPPKITGINPKNDHHKYRPQWKL